MVPVATIDSIFKHLHAFLHSLFVVVVAAAGRNVFGCCCVCCCPTFTSVVDFDRMVLVVQRHTQTYTYARIYWNVNTNSPCTQCAMQSPKHTLTVHNALFRNTIALRCNFQVLFM